MLCIEVATNVGILRFGHHHPLSSAVHIANGENFFSEKDNMRTSGVARIISRRGPNFLGARDGGFGGQEGQPGKI